VPLVLLSCMIWTRLSKIAFSCNVITDIWYIFCTWAVRFQSEFGALIWP
jgi:hypothetical protein